MRVVDAGIGSISRRVRAGEAGRGADKPGRCIIGAVDELRDKNNLLMLDQIHTPAGFGAIPPHAAVIGAAGNRARGIAKEKSGGQQRHANYAQGGHLK